VAGLHKILLVEDNLQLREMYKLFLEMHGFEVRTANDGSEGLAAAKAEAPDLIFLDIMMPRVDGLQVLTALRHDPQYGCTKAKIVLMTNLGANARITPQVRQDMDGYVIKAEIQLKDLLEVISSLEGVPDQPGP